MSTQTAVRPVMTKAVGLKVKAAGPGTDDDLAEGEFLALVSVFNNVDSYGDVVMPGAFAQTLADHQASGDPIPVVWSHDWLDPYSHIGWADPSKCQETPEGLLVRAQLDIASPVPEAASRALQVYQLLKGRRVRQFSFAFDVLEGGWGVRGEGDDAREVFELRQLGVHEVGPCLVGVNRETELQTVKAVRQLLAPSKSAGDAPAAPETPGTPVPDSTTPAGDPADGAEEPTSRQAEPDAATDEPRSKSAASNRNSPASVRALIALNEPQEGDTP